MRLGDVRDVENQMIPDFYPEYPHKVDCPICGEECESVYVDMSGEPAGCDVCLRRIDVEDWWDNNPNWE